MKSIKRYRVFAQKYNGIRYYEKFFWTLDAALDYKRSFDPMIWDVKIHDQLKKGQVSE